MAYLRLQFEGGRTQRAALDKKLVVIGRSSSCDLQVVDDKISRQHCQVTQHQGQWSLEDLGSRNKTWMNDQPVDQVYLFDGDQFRIGRTNIEFRIKDSPAQTPEKA